MIDKVTIGTRGSKLALIQCELLCNALKAKFPKLALVVKEIKTLGDRKQGTVEAKVSDKKEWVIDLEQALLRKEIDLAIHSGKDCPCDIEAGTQILPVLERAEPRDVFIRNISSPKFCGLKFKELSANNIIGTASLRRRAQLLNWQSDLDVIEWRGNVNTRIQKLEERKNVAGIVLAAAGLERLGYKTSDYEIIPAEISLPAANQGILLAQCRSDSSIHQEMLMAISDPTTNICFWAERTIVKQLQADCRSALAVFANCNNEQINIQAKVLSPDGKQTLCVGNSGPMANAIPIATQIAYSLLEQGAKQILHLA